MEEKAANRVVVRDTQQTVAILREKGAAQNYEDISEQQWPDLHQIRDGETTEGTMKVNTVDTQRLQRRVCACIINLAKMSTMSSRCSASQISKGWMVCCDIATALLCGLFLTSELKSECPDHWRRDAHTTCAKILNKPPISEGWISENSPRAGMGKNAQTCKYETCEGDRRKYPATIRVERSLGCTGLPGEVAHGAFKSVVLFLQNINGWVQLRN